MFYAAVAKVSDRLMADTTSSSVVATVDEVTQFDTQV